MWLLCDYFIFYILFKLKNYFILKIYKCYYTLLTRFDLWRRIYHIFKHLYRNNNNNNNGKCTYCYISCYWNQCILGRYVLPGRLARPPQMASEVKNLTVSEGDAIIMSCLAYSSEPCLTQWLRHHQINGSYLDAYNTLSHFTQITVRSFRFLHPKPAPMNLGNKVHGKKRPRKKVH